MKEGFRQSMSWLHTWLGLVIGWVLYFVYLTGTLGYVDKEIDYWMTPDRPYFAESGTPEHQLDLAQARLLYEQAAAGGSPAAMTNLGIIYENGAGVPRDLAAAQSWYAKAAEGGNAEAKTRLEHVRSALSGGAAAPGTR